MSQTIAIVGMSCLYPDATSPDELWDNVLARRRAFRNIPPQRLHGEATADKNDSAYVRHAAVLEGYEFDRVRFRVSGNAFRSTDYSHWLALDVADRALADAGFADAHGLPRATTGVLVGNTLTGEFSRANMLRLHWPYVRRAVERALGDTGWERSRRIDLLDELELSFKAPFPPVGEETLAGALSNLIGGRICNFFDFGGGGYTVDGACCSSLLAIAHACTALSAGDLDVALAGGVDLSLDPFELVGFSALGALATDQMRVYDARPTGFWPGEGCGFVVLMRARDAIAEGRRCYAMIRGWGISSDGNGGITRPEIVGQRRALQRAYRRAGMTIDQVQLIEGHGTGTAIGDEVELRALAAELEAARPAHPVTLSSIKANIGHTKAAAGIAGLIKTAMAVHKQILPPATGCDHPHPIFSEQAQSLRLLQTAEPWPAGSPVNAGVSAFGFGGINVHIILQGEPAATTIAAHWPAATGRAAASHQDTEILVLAADSERGLLEQVELLQTVASRISFAQLTDLAAVLANNQHPGYARAAILAATPAELAERLRTLHSWITDGVRHRTDSPAGVSLGIDSRKPRLGFLFPGQGAPLRVTGGALGRCLPEVDGVFHGAGVTEWQHADRSVIVPTQLAQPALMTAAAAGLLALRKLGIEATAAMGHSLGELAALRWAGAMDDASLLSLARKRGEATGGTGATQTAMASIAASADQVAAMIAAESPVTIAAFNAPTQTVISGTVAAVQDLLKRAGSAGIDARLLPISSAFHTPLMAPAGPVLAPEIAKYAHGPLRRAVYSTVTGQRLDAHQDLTKLLVDQLTQPVRFTAALAHFATAVDLAIEVGSGHVLANLVRENTDLPVVSLDVGADSIRSSLEVVAAAFVRGAGVDVARLFDNRLTRAFDLNREPDFLCNPCANLEQGLVVPATPEPAPDNVATPATLAPPRADDRSMLESLREKIAQRAELPLSLVNDDSRLLGDLHLSSITVSQVVSDVMQSHRLAPPVSPTDFSNASLAEVAAALEALAATDGAAGPRPEIPDGLKNWTRPFRIEWAPASTARGRTPQSAAGPWLIQPTELLDAQGLQSQLEAWGGQGIVVCLPEKRSNDQIAGLLQAAQAVEALNVDNGCFVLYQPGLECGAFARCLHLEHPQLTTCVIDGPADDHIGERILGELALAQGYHEVRYDSAGARWSPRLVETQLHKQEAHLCSDDVLLVSGGGKGIAAECALGIAVRTGARLVLLGRSNPDCDSVLAENLERMAAQQVDYQYLSTDITDRDAVRASIQEAIAAGGPITAVIHAAGSNQPAMIRDLTLDDFISTCAPKVGGLNNILAAIDASQLRLLISFGSIIARSGMRGEAHYALANEWLARDTAAFQAANPRCRCLTLSWSVWSGTGMGDRLGRIEALAREGIAAISTDQGVAMLGATIDSNACGELIVSGRIPDLPTLSLERPELPLLRFIETPRVYYPGIELVADAELSTDNDPYLNAHVLDGTPLLPGVIALEALAQAAVAVTGSKRKPVFEQVRFLRPVSVAKGRVETVRTVAQVCRDGSVELALRCGQTGFSVDHVTARCQFGEVSIDDCLRPHTATARVPLDPEADLYDSLLFHDGCFRRVTGYAHMDARSCVYEIAVNEDEAWFGKLLPQRRILFDPGARDAVIHAVQACIPDARLIPIAVERIVPGDDRGGSGPWTGHAREIGADNDTFTYDIDVYDVNGSLCEAWRGLRLTKVAPVKPRHWALPLLAIHLERGKQRHTRNSDSRVVIINGVHISRRERSDAVVSALFAGKSRLIHRADGKPLVDAGGIELSIAHSRDLTIGVRGGSGIACDLEEVNELDATGWTKLLGVNHGKLTTTIASQTGECEKLTATRIWVTRECLRKSGAAFDAPITLVAECNDDWVSFSAENRIITTYATSISGFDNPVVIGLLEKKDDARV